MSHRPARPAAVALVLSLVLPLPGPGLLATAVPSTGTCVIVAVTCVICGS